jgi:hypothetical protein
MDMDKVKRFVECMIPSYSCNLLCEYCYVIQGNYRDKTAFQLNYAVNVIKQATSTERFGGVCFFSLCAAGETMIPQETIDIARVLLENGHYVNITNNGTMSNRISELCALPETLRERLHLSFSFHYLELKRLGMLEKFFDNVNRAKNAGVSFFIQIAVCDAYAPYIKEIKEICKDSVGAFPQAHVARRNEDNEYSFFGAMSKDEYIKCGTDFESPLFDFTLLNFMKKRREFCYAGDWSCTLDLGTGVLSKCYSRPIQNIFDDIAAPIAFEAIGNNCVSPYCVNSSHFMSLGVIPQIETPSYAKLRDRPSADWYTPRMRSFLDGRLFESNNEYTFAKKMTINMKERLSPSGIIHAAASITPKPIKSAIKRMMNRTEQNRTEQNRTEQNRTTNP